MYVLANKNKRLSWQLQYSDVITFRHKVTSQPDLPTCARTNASIFPLVLELSARFSHLCYNQHPNFPTCARTVCPIYSLVLELSAWFSHLCSNCPPDFPICARTVRPIFPLVLEPFGTEKFWSNPLKDVTRMTSWNILLLYTLWNFLNLCLIWKREDIELVTTAGRVVVTRTYEIVTNYLFDSGET